MATVADRIVRQAMFFKKTKQQIEPEWMIVGLGNPGAEYRGTRHNVGFEVIERLRERHKIKLDRSRHRAQTGLGRIEGTGVLLVKPLTYMNLSGQSVAPLARQFGIKPEKILVVADDLDLPLGRVRLKPKGSAGGHNGHKSIIGSLRTTEYPRLKIGIGKAGETIDHVLSAFGRDEREAASEAIDRAVRACEGVLREGLDKGMNLANED